MPRDSSNRNYVINWLVTQLLMSLFEQEDMIYDNTPSTIQLTPSPGMIRYDLAQLHQRIPYLNVPGTWYLSWKRSPHRNRLTLVDYSSTSNVIVARLLCAYSRDNIVWLSYAHDLGQERLGAEREAGRPCVLATMVIRISVYRLPGT